MKNQGLGSELRKDIIIVLFFVLIAGLILSLFITSPFKLSDHDGAGGCFWGSIARNYVRYGYFTTKFGMVENSGSLIPSEFRYYTHHPPLIPIMMSVPLKVLGVHEWSIRAVFIFFGLGVIGLLYWLAKELWGRSVAVLSCIITLITPMFLHFSSVPDMVSVTLFFSLATVYFYIRWLKTKSSASLIGMSIMFLIATQTAWEAYHLIPAILWHNHKREKSALINLLIVGLGIASLSGFVIHVLILELPHELKANAKWALVRTGIYMVRANPSFILEYIKQILVWIWFDFTPPIAIISFLYLLSSFFKSRRLTQNGDFIFPFFVFGALKYFFLVNLSYYHPQRLYYLVPFFAFSSSLVIHKFLETSATSLKTYFLVITAILTVGCVTLPVFLQLNENDVRASFDLSKYHWDRPKAKKAEEFYDEFKKHIHEKLGAEDLLLISEWFPHLKYYVDRNTNETISTVERLQTVLDDTKGKKIVFAFWNGVKKSPEQAELLDYMKRNYTLTKSFLENRLLIFDVRLKPAE